MIYLIASIIIIVINVVPAFMPPTWTLISYFYISFDVNLFVLSLIGAVSSSFGRFLLTGLSRKTVGIFSEAAIDNLNFIGNGVKKKPLYATFFAFVWAISPIPSNLLFIAAGISKISLKYILPGFFLGRSLSYFSLAFASRIVVENFKDIFSSEAFDWQKILINILCLFTIFFYVCLDWKSLFIERKLRFNLVIFKKRKSDKR